MLFNDKKFMFDGAHSTEVDVDINVEQGDMPHMDMGHCGHAGMPHMCHCNNMAMPKMGMCQPMKAMYEQPIEKCVHRDIVHEVEHICPINTKVINRHIFKHTYKPCYTCTEENQVCEMNQGSCCNFR